MFACTSRDMLHVSCPRVGGRRNEKSKLAPFWADCLWLRVSWESSQPSTGALWRRGLTIEHAGRHRVLAARDAG